MLQRFFNWLRYFFIPAKMVKPEQILGELPSTGAIYKRAYDMAWPSTLESFLIGLVGMVDTIMVGTLGSGAIAAVGITNQPRFIVLAVIMSLNTGITAVVARRTGEKDSVSANRCLKQTLLLTLLLTVVLGTLAIIFSRPMLVFAGAGADIIDDAVTYFNILMYGLVFNTLTMSINSAQRGAGNTRISMTTNLTANFVNVFFNYVLIGGKLGFPALGVAGAAIATVIGSAVGFFMALHSVLTPSTHFLTLRSHTPWSFDKATMGSIYKVSSSALVEQVFMRIGFFAYSKIVAGLGTDAFATHQICMNIMTLSFTLGNGLQVACTSLVGQNLGAKRPDLSIIYGQVGQRISLCLSAILSVIFFTCAHPLIGMYTNDPMIIQNGTPLLYITALVTFAQMPQVVYSGALRGAGDTRYVAVVSMISIMIVRPILSYLLCYPLGFGLIGAWFGILLDQFMRLFATMPRFASGKWTKIKL